MLKLSRWREAALPHRLHYSLILWLSFIITVLLEGESSVQHLLHHPGTRMAYAAYNLAPQWGLLGFCSIKTEDVQLVELKSVSTQVTIRGFVAQVNAKLTYYNPGSEALQVHYRLPVDESAAVYKLEAHLDGRTISAQCMEKKKAENVYKEAVSAGKTAVLARQDENASDVLHLDLGNLPAESEAELNISCIMDLKVQTDGGVNFVLPTVLNPRYSPSSTSEKSNVLEHEYDVARVVTVLKAYTINIKCDISGGHNIARIISHTDSLNVTISEDAKSAQVTQDGGFKSDHDWSLLIYYANPYKTHIIRETGDRSTTGLMKDDLIMINLFPEVPSNSYSNKNEIIFIIDRSGSMEGENIQSARATLLLFLKSLPIGCFFNIVSFGSTFSWLFSDGSREYNKESLAEACELQKSLGADMGGTEILRPFQSIYSKPPQPGYSRQILLISDGEVWNVNEVTQLVGRHVHETRVFAVGIGHGASTALIKGVARAGKGYSEMVMQQDKLQHKVMGLVSSMVQESVQNVRVTFEVEPTSRVALIPKVPPVIFGGQHLVLYTRLPPTTTVKGISIKGNIGSAELSVSVQGSDVVTVHDTEMSLHRLAARAQINQWQLDEEEDVAEDMITLSVASGVVSKLTALVGVDQDGKPVKQIHHESPYRERSRIGMLHTRSGASQFTQLLSCMVDSQDRDVILGSCDTSLECDWQLCSGDRDYVLFDEKIVEDHPQKDLKRKSGVDLLDIVSVQYFDGSWTLTDVADLSGVTLAQLKDKNPSQNESAWATAVALALLESKFNSVRDEWSLLANKARLFISNSGEDVEALFKAAQLFLATQHQE
ncbi:von Willebrand factor A domain-containing protein 5A isoform X2 [Cherax quadricarinatus]|uniref:von Willebrand factor A domain-containing protein 5A isoform X2 n=1 Tax=Cherax quadricarinatus TaxID=27406 RepID=UPI00387E5C0B